MADLSQLEALTDQINIAENLDEDTLNRIATEILEQIQYDEDSRREWIETSQDYLKLAAQVKNEKSFPWPKASNTKYPLLTIAATQFHARAQQSLINETDLVKTKIIGRDPEGTKKARGNRISKYMTYQLTEEMDEWVDDMDRLLLIVPLCGMSYKKTYFSAAKGRSVSTLVLPQDLITSYYGRSFEHIRKTEVMLLSTNEIIEYQNKGIYLDVDLGTPSSSTVREERATDDIQKLSPSAPESDRPYTILESHCWYDLDEDGYKEPYIITLCRDSGKVVRMVARFDFPNMEIASDGKVISIPAKEYFTQYIFMPDPQSATHALGLGHLLGPLNHSVNTIINQLTDAGTLSNLQSGFLGRGIKLPIGGNMRFKPGEWKSLSSTGDDLRKNVFPLPVKEPSPTLFQLLGLLIQSGENAGSIADIMLGENPGQNQPYSTTLAVIEQGQKVFISIYKRIYRALKKEYKKLYRLNGFYLDPMKYQDIVDDPGASQEDWTGEDYDICPAADPNSVSDLQKLKKAEGLLGLAAQGLVNPQKATQLFLEALGTENIPELMQLPEPQPDFDQQIKIKELELQTKEIQAEVIKDFTQAMKNMASAKKENVEADAIPSETEIKQVSAVLDYFLSLREQETGEDQQVQENQLRQQEIEAKRNAGTN